MMLKIVTIISLNVVLIMAVITTLRENPQTYLEWEIESFFELSKEFNYSLDSPTFSLGNSKWFLRMYPNGHQKTNSTDNVDIYLRKNDSQGQYRVNFTFGFKTLNGSQFVSKTTEYTFDKSTNSRGFAKILKRSTILSSTDTLVPGGILTAFCTVRIVNSIKVLPEIKSSTVLDSPQNVSFCNQSNPLINESLPVSRTACNISQGTEILSGNLKDMYTTKRFADTTIICKDKEFSVHKNILFYRLPDFDSMLQKNPDRIEIADCDPESFEEFLRFIYIGKLVEMSPQKATSLYLTADKYSLYDLKEECSRYILEHDLNIDSFYDILLFANLQSDSMLLMATTEFFITNAKLILSTKKWEKFLEDEPIQVNKLLLAYVEKKSRIC